MLQLLVSTRFHVLFTPLPGFFSPFPRGTCSLSVTSQYLALPDGPGGFVQGFTCPVLLGILLGFRGFRLPDYHRLWWFSQTLRLPSSHPLMESRNPSITCVIEVWAVPRSLAATDGITVLFSFPPGTKMFQFPGLPLSVLWIQTGVTRHYSGGVAPFGDLRI